MLSSPRTAVDDNQIADELEDKVTEMLRDDPDILGEGDVISLFIEWLAFFRRCLDPSTYDGADYRAIYTSVVGVK